MLNLKTYILILFFGKAVLLTPYPVDLGPNWYEIQLNNPISAITKDAALYLDFTLKNDCSRDPKALDSKIPKETIVAELISESGATHELKNSGFIYKEKRIYAKLTSEGTIPVGIKFNKVCIKSLNRINSVLIVWNNVKF